jgi:predicted nucleotidyltransferase
MNNIVDILRANKELFFSKYPLKKMALFGSYSRGDQTEKSDVDILVQFETPVGLEFLYLSYELEDLLHRKVDLVSENAIKPRYLAHIKKDLIYV